MSAKDHGGAALSWLAHPLTVVALAVLLLNDHVLKAAYPGWLTGKLSDVAGLLVAPPLVALLLSATGRGFRATAVVAVALTGTLFTLVKISGYAAGVASAAWTAVAGPSRVLADPTDLLALPALLLAYHVGMRASRAPAPGRVAGLARTWLILPVALLGVAATSQQEPADAREAVVFRGEIYVNTVNGYLATVDGRTWREVPYQDEFWKDPAYVAARAAGAEASAPQEPDVRYRPLSGGLGVERSVNGGPWQAIWSVSEGRREYLARGVGVPAATLVTQDVAVHFGQAGRVVVVADGRDGIAVQLGDGPFERIGFPHSDWAVYQSQAAGARASGLPTPAPVLDVASAAPLTGIGGHLAPEIFLGLLVALAALTTGRILMRRSRLGTGTHILTGMLVAGLLLAWFAALRTSFDALFLGLPAAVLIVIACPFLLLQYAVDRDLPGRGRAALLGIALLGGAAFVAPFVGWSSGTPDRLDVAYLVAIPLAAAAVGAATWAGRHWRADPLVTARGADPSPPASPADPATPAPP